MQPSKSSNCSNRGNHVQLGHVVRMGECEPRQLVHVGHMARALGERHDVAASHLLPVALLDGADSAKRVQRFARLGVEGTADPSGAYVGQRALMHD